MLVALGRNQEATRWYELLSTIDPLQSSMHVSLAYEELFDGEAERARTRLARIVRDDPGCLGCLMVSAEIELFDGNHDAASEALRRYRERAPASAYGLVRDAQLLWTHEPARAAALLAEVDLLGRRALEGGSKSSRSLWLLAATASIRGEVEAALGWLTKAYAAGRLNWRFYILDPVFEPIRGTDGFSSTDATSP